MAEEETEIQVENAPQERPDWLPSNFQSPEDLAKSYTHATSKITEQGQELAALRSQIEEIQASQHQQQTQAQTNDIEQQLYDAYESGDGRAIAAANAFLVQQGIEQALKQYQPPVSDNSSEITARLASQELAEKYSDWQEVSPRIGELVQQDPTVLPVTATTPYKDVVKYLDRAYKLAKFENGQTAATSAAETLEAINRQNKQAAQTLTGTNSSTEDESYFDQIKAAKSGIPSFRL